MRTLILSLLTLFVYTSALSQIAQGPATGSVASGVVVNTNNFSPGDGSYGGPVAKRAHNKFPVYALPMPAEMPAPTGPEGSNYHAYKPLDVTTTYPPIPLASFGGIPQTSSIPPDPYMAVGPNHIITVVNTSFRISDKAGNVLKTIDADSWFGTALASPGAFDPKVLYDHFADRWIMVWLNQNDATQTAYFLVSVSDDSDPTGVWYNWALPSNVNGSTNSGSWTDYQGVGFDSQAFYFTGNTFNFSGTYGGVRVRILAKAQFYANTAGQITWTDFWQLRNNSFPYDYIFGVRPTIVYSHPGEYYLVGKPNLTGGTYFDLYRITNPLTSPAITCLQVPVTAWTNAPNAQQLGGGSLSIETGGSHLRHEPMYRDSSIWLAHSVNNGGYSSVRYIRISTLTNSATEDVSLGSFGYWHFYPALAVDRDKNIAIAFSRSGDNEYIGGYYTWRLNSDLPGLRDAVTIQPGKANYVKDFGSGRNRWGDYTGACIDPADPSNIWMHTEYAESPANTWGVWTNSLRLVPYSAARVLSSRKSVDFGLVEAGYSSDTVAVAIYNVGATTLTVSSVARSQANYTLLGVPTLPANIATFDSIRFRVVFHPTAHGVINDTIIVASNDPQSPTTRIPLHAKGIVIGQAQAGVMYATSTTVGSTLGQLYTINTSTGTATLAGSLGISEIDGLAIRPSTKELYGILSNASGSTLYRVSRQYGDALTVRPIAIPNMRAITFSQTGDTLFGGTANGRLYRINVTTGDTTYIGTASGKIYSGFAISPTSNVLWASVRPPLSGRDSILTVNRSTGASTGIGRTGLNVITPYLACNSSGRLFAIIGTGSQTNTLYSIDTLTGASTLIGSTGVIALQAIAMRIDSAGTSGVNELPSEGIPQSYMLSQNYPNPFNPTTTIRYALPRSGHITIKAYNMIGQEVALLVDGMEDAGFKSVTFDGSRLSSGTYIIEMRAGDFVASRKIMLLK
jgi:hypothetical protein